MRIWFWLALLAWCATAWGEEDELLQQRKSIGQAVQPFSLQDFRGRQYSLEDFREHPILVVAFLGTECPLAKLYALDWWHSPNSFSHRELASWGSTPIRRTR